MEDTERIEEEEMEEDNKKQPKLRVIQGGKGPPNTDVNWLKDMEAGTVFLCRKKGVDPTNPFIEQWEVLLQRGICTRLSSTIAQEKTEVWVFNQVFDWPQERNDDIPTHSSPTCSK